MEENIQQAQGRTRQQKLQLIFLIAVVVLFALSLGFGIMAGLRRGSSLATYENAKTILKALQSYKVDQTQYPSAYEFSQQRILRPIYLQDYPTQVAKSGACSNFQDFVYSQTKPNNFTFQFCLSKPVAGLSAGIHTVTEQGNIN